MAKLRIINTRFWIDDYISNLDPIEKLLFLYFLTNPMTNICGVYEIPLKIVAVETGIEEFMVKKIIHRFEKEGKMVYLNGWIGIKNFQKHQSINPKVKKGIENGLLEAPKEIVNRLGIDYDSLSHSNLNSNSNINRYTKEGAEVIKAFEEVNVKCKSYYNNTTQRSAADSLIKNHGMEKVLAVIKILPQTNGIPFFPIITTPVHLDTKWSALEASMRKKKSELQTKVPKVIFS